VVQGSAFKGSEVQGSAFKGSEVQGSAFKGSEVQRLKAPEGTFDYLNFIPEIFESFNDFKPQGKKLHFFISSSIEL